MTAKEFCLQYKPELRAEYHKHGRIKGMEEKYFLIRELGKTMYYASGSTESKAWKQAKEYILDEQQRLKEGQ